MVDANSVFCITEKLLGLSMVVIDRQFWNLELAAMGIANEDDLFSVIEVWRVDLCRLHRVHRQNDLSSLTLHSCGLQMNRGCVDVIGVGFEQLPLHGRVGQRVVFVEDFLPILECCVEPLFDQTGLLL